MSETQAPPSEPKKSLDQQQSDLIDEAPYDGYLLAEFDEDSLIEYLEEHGYTVTEGDRPDDIWINLTGSIQDRDLETLVKQAVKKLGAKKFINLLTALLK